MEHGAWSMEHGAERKKNALWAFLERGQTVGSLREMATPKEWHYDSMEHGAGSMEHGAWSMGQGAA